MGVQSCKIRFGNIEEKPSSGCSVQRGVAPLESMSGLMLIGTFLIFGLGLCLCRKCWLCVCGKCSNGHGLRSWGINKLKNNLERMLVKDFFVLTLKVQNQPLRSLFHLYFKMPALVVRSSLKKHPEEDLTFESMKKVLMEPPEHDALQNKLNEIFKSLTVNENHSSSDEKKTSIPTYEQNFPELFYY
ncbi:hypothetical protein NQ317_004485 [Molorchus minor]|uniref:Uncharacterized protein n=1 Tax=Molorchus minor TaxID=1323400 RepID=A0ABQ9IUV7_9CUCU|nr:hypothetical protein NQ317_004485 [Molorchus minor]